MIKGWKRMIRSKRLAATQEATGADEAEARFIDAIETGRIDGDVKALDERGRPVKQPQRSIEELTA